MCGIKSARDEGTNRERGGSEEDSWSTVPS